MKMAEKLYKRVENILGKGEIARYEQFLLFPQCFFKRLVLQTRKNKGLQSLERVLAPDCKNEKKGALPRSRSI